MTSTIWGWGVRPAAAAQDTDREAKPVRLPPTAVRDAHNGVVWLHATATTIWLFVATLLGALMMAGKAVPPAVVVGGAAAAVGHALFLTAHLYLAHAARRRAAHSPIVDRGNG
ncbi:MAG: hypothetical protein HY332_22800 [Chloroflexi bacterium]|nr:hypothetical protein [Chloroflexota bacterium]